MPIEIKELHIRINVSENTGNAAPEQNGNVEKDKIIEACVEQVMELLAKKEDR